MKLSKTIAALVVIGASAMPAYAEFQCEDGAITVGIPRAKTGGFAFYDLAGARGIEIGFDEVNAAGGIDGCPIKIISGDTQSDAALAGQVTDELIREGADIIIAPSDFDIGIGAAMAASNAGLFSMSPESSSITWTQAVPNNFLIGGTTEDTLGKTIAHFVDSQDWGTAYIVTDTAFSFFTETERAFREGYEGEVVGQDAVNADATDYSAVVSKIRAEGDNVEVIFLNDFFPNVATFLKQARAAGIDAPIVGNGTFSSTTLPEVVGAAGLQDVYYVASAYYEGDDIDPALKAMTVAYEEKFGLFPENTNSIVAYYAARIISEALEVAGSTDAASITEAVLAQTEMELPGAAIYEWDGKVPTASATVIGFTPEGKFREVAFIDTRTLAD